MVQESDEVTSDAGHERVNHTRHHERVVQQVLADDGSARAVEVHRSDIRGIVSLVMKCKCSCFLLVISNLTILGIVILNILKDI